MIDRPPVEALVIDPNDEDVRLFQEGLENVATANNVSAATSGAEALEFFRQWKSDPDQRRPNLVFLDIDLPEMDWRTLLEKFDADPEWTGIPVVIFTELDEQKFIAQSYSLHANAYVCKPDNRDEFLDIVCTLVEFWFDFVWLPPGDETDDKRQ